MTDRDASTDRACLDAETLAVWAEGALPSSQATAVEAHVADCARCQELVATFALTEPDTVAAPAASPARAPWKQWLWLPAGVGLAAAAVIFLAVALMQSTMPSQPESQAAKAEAPVAAPIAPTAPAPTPVAPPPASPRKREPARKAAPPVETKTMTAAAPASMPAPPPPPPMPPPAPVAMAPRPAPQMPPPGVVGGMVGSIPGSAVGGVTSGVAEMRMERSANARDAWTLTPLVEFASPGNRPAASRGGGGGNATMALNVAAPPTITRWRVTTATKVERSADNGRTWTTVDLGSAPVTITNGAAPSAQVCWLVGRGGLVLRSADGVTFARVTFPEPLELISITATDLLHATVTATDGRQFTTADGGLTWK